MTDRYHTGGYHAGRRSRGAIPWLAAGAFVVLVVFGIAFAVLLTGNSAPVGSGNHHKQQALAAATPPATTAPAQSASPSPTPSKHKPAPKTSHSASPSPTPQATSRTPSPKPKPRPTHKPPAPPAPPPVVQLTANVSANGWNSDGWVSFGVNDTGGAATGQVTVTITLPAGATMTGTGGGGDAVVSPLKANSGWSCQATSGGATCTHASVAAGGQAGGSIRFTASAGSVCGQVVDVNAASGSVSASAQSTVSC